jgi:hypothetical protein
VYDGREEKQARDVHIVNESLWVESARQAKIDKSVFAAFFLMLGFFSVYSCLMLENYV